MNKLIIEYDEAISPFRTLLYARDVIEMGKISRARGREQYCFLVTFKDGIVVYSTTTRAGSDKLTVTSKVQYE